MDFDVLIDDFLVILFESGLQLLGMAFFHFQFFFEALLVFFELQFLFDEHAVDLLLLLEVTLDLPVHVPFGLVQHLPPLSHSSVYLRHAFPNAFEHCFWGGFFEKGASGWGEGSHDLLQLH